MVSILLIALLVVLGVGAAAGTSALLVTRQTADAPPAPDPEDIANRIAQRAAQQQQAALGNLIETNRALLDAERLRSGEALASERSLIEAQFGNVRTELDKVTALVREFESGRGAKIEELSGALAAQRAGIADLASTAAGLREALASSKTRGQWGERMAEDVLRLAGFVEGINYRKQVTLSTAGRPDYTFLMPNGLVMHMDVKFPLDNYMRFLDSTNDVERV